MAQRSPWSRLAGVEAGGLVAAVVCLGAIPALGGMTSPWLDFFAHLEPFYLVAGLTLILLTAIPARRALPGWRTPLLALGALAAGSAAWLVGPELIGDLSQGGSPGAAPVTLTVLTQNSWQRNTEVGATVDGILKANADIVMLQELDGSMRDLPARLATAYPYRADCTVITEWCDLAILSKRPILSWTHHEPAWKPPEWDRLSLVEATIDAGPGGPVPVYTTHLMHPSGEESVQQTEQFLRAIGGADTRRSVIGGDFNRPPWSFALRRLDAGIPIPRRTHGVFSWPNRLPWGDSHSRFAFPFLPLDQIYAGRDWRVLGVTRAPSTGSDHYGVLATLALMPAAS